MHLEWRLHKFGSIAFALASFELIAIWGATAIALQMPQYDWHWLETPLTGSYILGFCSIPVAIIGLVRDSRRTFAMAALVLGLANVAICTVPFAA